MNQQLSIHPERGRKPLGALPAGSHSSASAARRRGATFIFTLLALLWGWMLLPAAASADPLDLKISVSDDPVVRGQGFFYRLMATNTREAPLTSPSTGSCRPISKVSPDPGSPG